MCFVTIYKDYVNKKNIEKMFFIQVQAFNFDKITKRNGTQQIFRTRTLSIKTLYQKKRLVQGASNLEGDLETSKSLQNFSKYKYYLS